uniref:bifunctional heparan sulfate N-deacetylase/N-sulfotransferase 3-like n=1 Tax=Styela clava TaxID=7725 RepID=UPI001939BFF9|nr:bifunctional heparan sulfate N-deacetylase/N-sulfotransferase 3-like [Styela clava]
MYEVYKAMIVKIICEFAYKTTCSCVLQDGSSQSGKQILYLLQATRLKYHTQYGTIRNLPALIDNNKGRYAAIIFEDIDIYLQLNQWNREILDKYCVEYDVGVILFALSEKNRSVKTLDNQQIGNFPLNYSTNVYMKDCEINPESKILRVTRAGEIVSGRIGRSWTIFNTNHSTYEIVTSAALYDPDGRQSRRLFPRERRKPKQDTLTRKKRDLNSYFSFDFFTRKMEKQKTKVIDTTSTNAEIDTFPTVLLDRGKYDQIQRVFFGNNLSFWLNKILFMDALSYLSHGKLSLPLERYIQIDIDDIFVSAVDTRMTEEDVMELVKFQKDMRKRIQGFNFLLGFTGKFYQKGNPKENEGDATFLRESHNFLWFPHMWSHMQAHLFNNKTSMCSYMIPNKQFAERHKFNVSTRYAVAPHHSGIFPVHEPLYECWKEIWDIETTSTEEYPNLRPDNKRRGFIYRDIKVLPRQTCGLFTHTNYLDKYPGGREKLEEMIHGGLLFQTFLFKKYNIYMTHFSNYGNDRLALYVFDKAIEFVQCWTNLRVIQVPPSELAKKYFDEYPDEIDPIWTNPCADPRHLEIWSKEKSCDKLPKFVIVGPQKSGTTALHWFLQMHPDLQPSRPSPQTFEEIQFFNTDNYLKGLDWYMDFFPIPSREEETFLYEKSANYFENDIAPRRLSALLPKAHIIVLLIDPAKRAYSWYQHMKSKDDPTAIKYSFDEVIKAKRKGSSTALLQLQKRCLKPGQYEEHIDRWTEYLPARQIILEDGELLVKDPITVLQRLQKSLGLPNIFDYSEAIRFDERKGFFCKIQDGGNKCLGKSKGRKYPEMSEDSRRYLDEYYEHSNTRLVQILQGLQHPIPTWLSSLNSTVT